MIAVVNSRRTTAQRPAETTGRFRRARMALQLPNEWVASESVFSFATFGRTGELTKYYSIPGIAAIQ